MATKITRVFQKDKVVGLTHSAGNISIQSGSVITVGGLQYVLDSQKSVALPAMIPNTRYQVFAVASGSDIALVVQARENSLGPVGYSSWKLVGSLLANYLGAFGAFINIVGKPVCNAFDNGVIGVSATGGGAVKGPTTEDVQRMGMDGEFVYIQYRYKQSTPGTGGTGSYLIDMPANVPINTTKSGGIYTGSLTAGTGDVRAAAENMFDGLFATHVGTSSLNYSMMPVAFSTTQFRLAGGWLDAANTSTWGVSANGFANTALGMSGWMKVQTTSTSFTNTPIEEL